MDAIFSQRIALTRSHGQERVQTQRIMIVKIFVTQSQAIQTLSQQLFQGVIHEHLIARDGETSGQSARNTHAPIDLTQEQDSAGTAKVAAGKVGFYLACAQVIEEKRLIGGKHVSSLGSIYGKSHKILTKCASYS